MISHKWRRSAAIGWEVGVSHTCGHCADPGSEPRFSSASSPALRSEDFPAPEGATTTSAPPTARQASRRTSSLATSASRPKNHCDWSVPNAARPGYGHSSDAEAVSTLWCELTPSS